MGKAKKALALVFCMSLALGIVFGGASTALAASTGTVYVSVKQDYSDVKVMLKQVNKQRTKRGLNSLKLDKTLTNAAVQRAAEVAITVPTTSPHKRPDGRRASTVNSRVCYECCSESWYGDPKGTVDDWMTSPSHKAGILLSGTKSIGIGCVTVANNGVTQQIWTLEFSRTSAKGKYSPSGTKRFTKKVKVLNSKMKKAKLKLMDADTWDAGSSQLAVGDSCTLNGVYTNKYLGWYIPLVGKSFTWKSSSPSVASVTKTGKVKALAPGTATISAKLKDGTKRTVTMKITVEAADME